MFSAGLEIDLEVRRALANGRTVQEMLYEAAGRYVKALKRRREEEG
jgi:hypothetical protein